MKIERIYELMICFGLITVGCVQIPTAKFENYRDAAKGVVDSLALTDEYLVTELPVSQQELSVNGRVCIQNLQPTGNVGVVFVYFKGRGDNFEGFFVSDKLDIDMINSKDAYQRKTISLWVPIIGNSVKSGSASFVAEAFLESTTHKSVFRVGFDLD